MEMAPLLHTVRLTQPNTLLKNIEHLTRYVRNRIKRIPLEQTHHEIAEPYSGMMTSIK